MSIRASQSGLGVCSGYRWIVREADQGERRQFGPLEWDNEGRLDSNTGGVERDRGSFGAGCAFN